MGNLFSNQFDIKINWQRSLFQDIFYHVTCYFHGNLKLLTVHGCDFSIQCALRESTYSRAAKRSKDYQNCVLVFSFEHVEYAEQYI